MSFCFYQKNDTKLQMILHYLEKISFRMYNTIQYETVAERPADLDIAADRSPHTYDSAHLCCLCMCIIRGHSALPYCAAEQQSAALCIVLRHFTVTKYSLYEFEIGSHTS